MSSLGLLLRVLRAEGVRAVIDRLLDRTAAARRLRRLARLDLDWVGEIPVLNVSPMPLSPLRGGSLVQLLDRLSEEAGLRPVALLSPAAGCWRLETHTPQRQALSTVPATTMLEAIGRTVAVTRSEVVHVECLAGLDLEQVARLSAAGCRTVLSLHDFSLLCRRPHLLELPARRFCGLDHDLEHDLARCLQCLGHDGRGVGEDELHRHRLAGAAALEAADTVVFVSQLLRDAYSTIFRDQLRDRRLHIIPPASSTVPFPSTVARRPRQIAFVGGIKEVKGGALVPAVVRHLRSRLPAVRCIALGEVEPHLSASVRQLAGLRVRGYYRAGHLPRLLRRYGATVAVLPSIVPETYGLVVDECLRAGVPVVAFDHGGVAERLRRLATGRVVPLGAGAIGLAEATLELLEDPGVPESIETSLPTLETVANAHLELYHSVAPG